MTWQDFWSTTFPAYLGALGSIAASAVAVAAFIRDIRTRAGLREVAAGATTVEVTATGGPRIAAQQRPAVWPSPQAARTDDPHGEEPRLELSARGTQTLLRNLGTAPIRITDLRVPSGGKAVTLRTPLPAPVEPGEGYGFVIRDLLGGPAVTALLVEWSDATGTTRVSRFFI